MSLIPPLFYIKNIQNLNSNKVHGRDNTGNQMLETCGTCIDKPLELIFKQALTIRTLFF